jgi:hypothetical protein
MSTKAKGNTKSAQLLRHLRDSIPIKINLVRLKCISQFICALCKVQTVNYDKLAAAFESKAQTDSSLRRIQRFFADYALNSDRIAQLIFKLLPHKPPFQLALDRTNWKFGQTNINVLMLAIVYQGTAFPIMFQMLDKRGCSDTQERINLIERFIRLFGTSAIDCLLADREFVGKDWIKYLNDNDIRYYIRIRENFKVRNPKNNQTIKVARLFSRLKCGEHEFLHQIYYIGDQLCYLAGAKVKNKKGIPELQIIDSFNKPENAQDDYKKRWQIETAFKGLKSSGFNIEDTHLTDLQRIEKLFSLVMVAFAWAYVVGVYVHENIKPIKIKKHGHLAKSIFKNGLQNVATALLNPYNPNNINIFQFLSCT